MQKKWLKYTYSLALQFVFVGLAILINVDNMKSNNLLMMNKDHTILLFKNCVCAQFSIPVRFLTQTALINCGVIMINFEQHVVGSLIVHGMIGVYMCSADRRYVMS